MHRRRSLATTKPKPKPNKYKPPSEREQFLANQYFFGINYNQPPLRGTIRFLHISKDTVPFWISNILYSCDKSLTEWYTTLQNYKQNSAGFTFISDATNMLEAMVMKQFQLRTLARKCIRNIRIRIAERRVIGEIDLYTTTPIPKNSQVRVYDFASKSVYVFHTQTAIRIILSGLQYSLYGIPNPHMPKNPYTNMPFHYTQIMTMMEQIFINCARVHHIPPARLFHFRKCMYSIELFSTIYRHNLNMESAKTLLHSFHDPVSLGFYMEVLNDTIQAEALNTPRWNIIQTYIQNRSLPTDILQRFDNVVVSLFLYQNHRISYTFRTYEAMLTELERAYRAALQWWKPRAGAGASTIAAPANAQILEHV